MNTIDKFYLKAKMFTQENFRVMGLTETDTYTNIGKQKNEQNKDEDKNELPNQ